MDSPVESSSAKILNVVDAMGTDGITADGVKTVLPEVKQSLVTSLITQLFRQGQLHRAKTLNTNNKAVWCYFTPPYAPATAIRASKAGKKNTQKKPTAPKAGQPTIFLRCRYELVGVGGPVVIPKDLFDTMAESFPVYTDE